ncbi:peptidase M50 [Allorhodopirellula heiligendammensis]|uniref:Peptidase family M50 n=1 Tax=Allorhodopirellula heiligendammensis TaxID=2714739 RepID=A0A5C6BWX9_9BACT|nr:peptidase M50 [Allorhodopirellula heiligendammensis]TWU16800.1 Peptidase family M50 [Allorhodopirellula heiligendammensis]
MSVPRLQLRPDLIMRRISLRDRCVWVLKDPLSRRLHFFEEAEFAILRRLRSSVAFANLAAYYRDRLPPAVLAQFLSSATRAGILVTTDGVAASPAWRPAPPPTRTAWWKNPLVIRLPGITPDRHALFQLSAGLFTPSGRPRRGRPAQLHRATRGSDAATARLAPEPQQIDDLRSVAAVPDTLRTERGTTVAIMTVVAAIIFLAALSIMLRQQDFIDDLANAGSHLAAPLAKSTSPWATGPLASTLLVFASAIAVTKIFHELAHAWVCHRLGGRCREIGVLLLFGIPCLYCDVSDAWLMPRRRDRILVSAAGVIAEWMVAAVAALVWAATRPGLLHDVSTLIVVVASVNTFLINANPLLRYDGYYILSDATGVPNLADEANLAIRRTWSNWCGTRSESPASASPQKWLVAYGIASNAYRLFVLGVIGWAVFSFLKVSIGYGAALPIVLVLGFTVLRQRWANLVMSGPRAHQSHDARWGGGILSVAILLGILVLTLVPLPHSVRVGSLIRPLGERPIYLSTAGILLPQETETQVRLDDWRLRIKELASRGRIAELESELAASRVDRIDHPSLSLIQPILADQIASEQENHRTLVNRLDQLSISIAPQEKLFAPPLRHVSRQEQIAGRWGWTGTPLQPANVGATLGEGTLLGRVGSPDRRVASLYVPEHTIDEVRIGQSVIFGYGGLPRGSIRGRVASISADPVDSAPEEVLAAGWLGSDPIDRDSTMVGTVHYEVIVALESVSSKTTLPARLVTPARIRFPASSLWSRWRRWFQQ